MEYVVDLKKGELPRDREEIDKRAWNGIRATIHTRINDGSFGKRFPERCEDGEGTTGTNEQFFWEALRARIPALPEGARFDVYEEQPQTLDILRVIAFCWQHVAEPIQESFHPFFRHYHFRFDQKDGQEKFRGEINEIFRINGIAYELSDEGSIMRLVSPAFQESMARSHFYTGDSKLDRLLETSLEKFLNPDEDKRHEALNTLWDAWERLKTTGNPDKKAGITLLLDVCAGNSSPKFRAALESEAKELNRIGNSHGIRHSEKDQESLAQGVHVDYLFYRMFSLIQMILRTNT